MHLENMNLLKLQYIFIVIVGVTLFLSSCKEEEGCSQASLLVDGERMFVEFQEIINPDSYKGHNSSSKIIGDSIFTILNTKTF